MYCIVMQHNSVITVRGDPIYIRVMRRSRRTYTLAMGEWTAGNHDKAGHRSGTQSFGKSGVHACNVHGMHILPLPWRWSGVTCVCPLRLTIFLRIYMYGCTTLIVYKVNILI